MKKKKNRSPEYLARKESKKTNRRSEKRKNRSVENMARKNDNKKKKYCNSAERERSRRSPDYYVKKKKRKNIKRKENETRNERRSNHISQLRNDEEYRTKENENKKTFRNCYENLKGNYESSIRSGPIHLCGSCGGMFFKKSIKFYEITKLVELVEEKDIVDNLIKFDDRYIQLCYTCFISFRKGIVPKLCLLNGLEFPPIPDELKDLTELEERLISPRLPFMQIRELGIDKQYGLRGNVVNVPISINNTVKLLPRSFNKTETIQILLKRMRQHKSSYIKECINLYRVKTAAQYIVNQPLLQEEGIVLSDEWHNIHVEEIKEFIIDTDEEQNIESQPLVNDEWDETINDLSINPSNNQTLLQEGNIFAPGEGIRPVSLLCDEFAEELSFPTIFCGQKRIFKTKLSFTD